MTPFADNLALRRAAALLLLATVLVALVPPLASPVGSWLAGRETVEEERRILDRLARLETRRAAVLDAARTGGPAPFLVAADAQEALAALSDRARVAVPSEALQIEALEPLASTADTERPGAPVGLVVRWKATPSGIYAFLRDLENGTPAVRVRDVTAAVTSAPGAPVVLAGMVELRAAFLLSQGGQP